MGNSSEENELAEEIENVQAKLLKVKPLLEDAEKRFKTHKERFDAIRRLLVVVFDHKLFDLAVRGCSPVRRGSNFTLHRLNIYNEVFKDALNHVDDMVDDYAASLKEAIRIDPNLKEDTDRLAKLVYDTDGYFEDLQNVDTIETEVDNHLLDHDMKHPEEASGSTDARHLVKWLESMAPIV